MRNFLSTLALSALLVGGCSLTKSQPPLAGLPIRYHNKQYNFTFYLTERWRGYSVQIQDWKPSYSDIPESAKRIVLRHPGWTEAEPCEDIPVLVFTRSQWERDKQGKLSYGAGGMEMEISHNRNYVFAVWSRFNFDDLRGAEEAWSIVHQNSLANEPHLYPE